MHSKNNKIKTAFTLIELLVVIAIIGILSGLIIVGMSSSVNSARIAKSQIFSASLKDSLLMNLISEWKLDCSGVCVADNSTATTAYTKDSWGSNSGTIIGGAPKVYSGSNCVYSNCLKFDGLADYISIPHSASLKPENQITIAAWIKPLGGTASDEIYRKEDGTSRHLFRIGSFGISVGGTYSELGCGIDFNSYLNNWHLLIATFDGSTRKIYSDSVLTAQNSVSGSIGTSGMANVYIGSSAGTSEFFNGFIDDIRIYNSAIPASLIKEFYYAGLNRLFENGGIAKGDYQKRMIELAIHE